MTMKLWYKELMRAAAIGVIIFFVLLFIAYLNGQEISWSYYLLVNFGYTMLYSLSLYTVNAFIFFGLDVFLKEKRMSAKGLLLGFAISFVASLFVIFLLRIFEDVIIEGESWKGFLAEEKLSNYYVAMLITIVVTFLVHLIYFYKRYQENKVKQQKIIAGTASAKFETLKNQIDPHFLFNSLNVLSALIEEDPDSAQKFTTSLSKVYRYVLEQRDKELVSVHEELAFAQTYMNLLKMRFENSIFFDLPDTIINTEAKVVPLSLQLLLENTIKHNTVSQQKPLRIKIFEQNDYLVVQNEYRKKEVLSSRKGVGLQNIISRYAIISRRQVIIEKTEKFFTVKLPLLTKQVTIMENTTYYEKESSYNKAKKKVEEIKGFYSHLTSYIVVMTGITILNLLTSPLHYWFIYPAIGWGLGITAHGMSVFNYMPLLGKSWEERKIKEFIEKEKNKNNKWK